MRTIEIGGGMRINQASELALAEANKSGEPVQFTFNGSVCTARPRDTADIVEVPFWNDFVETGKRDRRRERLAAEAPGMLVTIAQSISRGQVTLPPGMAATIQRFALEWKEVAHA